MFKVYGYISDGGDGSACLLWTSNPDSVDLDEDERYYLNEGCWAEVLEFPNAEAAKACGLNWNTEEDE